VGLLLSARRAGEIDQLLHVAPLLQARRAAGAGAQQQRRHSSK